MYRMLIVGPLMAIMLTACLVAPPHHGSRVVIAPALPSIVILDADPYYYQQGYYYYYDNSRWRYSNSRSGPWADLPNSHYPKETRFKGRRDGRDGDRGHDHGRRGGDRDRDYDYDRRGRD